MAHTIKKLIHKVVHSCVVFFSRNSSLKNWPFVFLAIRLPGVVNSKFNSHGP